MFYANQPRQPQQADHQQVENNNNVSLGATSDKSHYETASSPSSSQEIASNTNKRSESAEQTGSLSTASFKNSNTGAMSNCEPERRYRPQKYCSVCGDKAIACNFNAVTCESCKAFFRRNAFKEQKLKCLFDNRCEITRVTRRFCSKCRLIKCFQIGMKREWILTDEQKRIKKVKIMHNKQAKQQRLSSDGYSGEEFSPKLEVVAETIKQNGQYEDSSYPSSRVVDQMIDRPTSTNQRVGGSGKSSRNGTQQAGVVKVEMRDASTSCPDEFELEQPSQQSHHSRTMMFHSNNNNNGHNNFCSFASHCQYCSVQISSTQMRPHTQEYRPASQMPQMIPHRSCDQPQSQPQPQPQQQPQQPLRFQYSTGQESPSQQANLNDYAIRSNMIQRTTTMPPCCCGNSHYNATGAGQQATGGASPHLHAMNPPQAMNGAPQAATTLYNSVAPTHLCPQGQTGGASGNGDMYTSHQSGQSNGSNSNNQTACMSSAPSGENPYSQTRNPFVMALDVRPLHSLYGPQHQLQPQPQQLKPSSQQANSQNNNNNSNENCSARNKSINNSCEVSTTALNDNNNEQQQLCMESQIVMNDSLSIY